MSSHLLSRSVVYIRKRFTLAVLGCLVALIAYAIINPQYYADPPESKPLQVASSLAVMRQVLELYKVQHSDEFPTDPVTQLLQSTDRTGHPGGEYGPYLRIAFPINAINADARVGVVETMPDAPVGDEGWLYCVQTGEIRANVIGRHPAGMAFFEL